MHRSPFGELVYADGSTFSPPYIESNYGWDYKPDMLRTESEIRQGKNKCWPRGSDDASRWLKGHIRDHFISRGWEMPVKASVYRDTVYSTHSDSLAVNVFVQPYGWITLGVSIVQLPMGDTRVTYQLSGPQLLGYLVQREVDTGSHGWSTTKAETHTSKNAVMKAVDGFIRNPKEAVIPRLAELWDKYDFSDRVLKLPADELMNLEYLRDNTPNHKTDVILEPISATSSGNGLFYRQGVIEKVVQDESNWETLQHFLEALSFVGYQVQPRWEYDWQTKDNTLRGVKIEIPKQGDMSAHTVHINAQNPMVSITCGFQQDEERWVERKQREAAEQMADLMDALEPSSYEIEL